MQVTHARIYHRVPRTVSEATEIRIIDNDRKLPCSLIKEHNFLHSSLDRIIGFTKRIRTVSEGEDPAIELLALSIDLAALRTAEREHAMTVCVQECSSTAIVEPLAAQTLMLFL